MKQCQLNNINGYSLIILSNSDKDKYCVDITYAKSKKKKKDTNELIYKT